MLKNLSINNIALIDSLDLQFDGGLTVLSGETGSGKSIIIDSLSFVLGDRADKSLIKYGTDHAEVTALFELDENDNVCAKLAEYGYAADDGLLLLSRKMSLAGKNEIRVQGKPSTLAILRDVAGELVDIFGQGEHLALLDENKQLSVLDAFCVFGDLHDKIAELKKELNAVDKEIAEFGGNDEERERTLDFLRYQINEIAAANLSVEEEGELIALRKRMMNAEKITQALNTVVQNIGGDCGATNTLAEARDALRGIAVSEQMAAELEQRINAVLPEIADIADTCETLLGEMDFSEADADKTEDRLELIKNLKRKYGGSVEAVLAFYAEAVERFDKITHSEERLAELTAQRAEIVGKLYKLCLAVSDLRKKCAARLASDVMKELTDLGMKNTKFVVEFVECPTIETFAKSPSVASFDKVRFLMSANPGEPLKPLAKVISGGEMSRFMLAVKNITARAEHIPTMVFDEIDTGISGKMAQMVANKLANVAADKNFGYQCIVITHLPQIAAMADDNMVISKVVENDRTHTVVSRTTDNERVQEVARLMGGSGAASVAAAKELVAECDAYKRKIK